MKILLDTSGYVAFKREFQPIVEAIIGSETILFSTIVLGELMFGFRNGSRFRENMKDLKLFLEHESVETIGVGSVTSDRYSRISADLKNRGTPIPTNDIWIAAQTVESGAELITCDHHFDRIAGLVCSIF